MQDSKYPPYNLIEEKNNVHRIEIAVAGFDKEDIKITEEDNKLTIKGRIKQKELKTKMCETWHHNGLAQRDFTHCFNIAPNVEITDVKLNNGILILKFYKDDEKNKKVINIT